MATDPRVHRNPSIAISIDFSCDGVIVLLRVYEAMHTLGMGRCLAVTIRRRDFVYSIEEVVGVTVLVGRLGIYIEYNAPYPIACPVSDGSELKPSQSYACRFDRL